MDPDEVAWLAGWPGKASWLQKEELFQAAEPSFPKKPSAPEYGWGYNQGLAHFQARVRAGAGMLRLRAGSGGSHAWA